MVLFTENDTKLIKDNIDSSKHEFTILPIFDNDKVIQFADINANGGLWSDIGLFPKDIA
jgi:hypothetical protein